MIDSLVHEAAPIHVFGSQRRDRFARDVVLSLHDGLVDRSPYDLLLVPRLRFPHWPHDLVPLFSGTRLDHRTGDRVAPLLSFHDPLRPRYDDILFLHRGFILQAIRRYLLLLVNRPVDQTSAARQVLPDSRDTGRIQGEDRGKETTPKTSHPRSVHDE